jgi:hypothetical protein
MSVMNIKFEQGGWGMRMAQERLEAPSVQAPTVQRSSNRQIPKFTRREGDFRAMDSLAPAQSALRPSLFANPFRSFPSCSNPGGSSPVISLISVISAISVKGKGRGEGQDSQDSQDLQCDIYPRAGDMGQLKHLFDMNGRLDQVQNPKSNVQSRSNADCGVPRPRYSVPNRRTASGKFSFLRGDFSGMLWMYG